MRIVLCDRSGLLYEAFAELVRNVPPGGSFSLTACQCDIFDPPTRGSVLVSPANSFGFMDGGIDGVYTGRFGPRIQERVQSKIRTLYSGELLVGQALFVPTDDVEYPFVISAPTMRVPQRIVDPTDVMLASRAAARMAIEMKTEALTFPGMGTGVGMLPPSIAARMMCRGIAEAFHPRPFPESLSEAVGYHNGTVHESIRRIIG